MKKTQTRSNDRSTQIEKNKKPKTQTINNFGVLSREERVTTIYIGNLSYSKDEFQLKKLFAKYGKVTYIRLVRDTKTLKSKGFAFVQMPNKLDAQRAIENLNQSQLDGRTLKVSTAVENDSIVKISSTPKVKTQKGESINGQSPEVADEKTLKPQRRKRVRGLDLLFQNTK